MTETLKQVVTATAGLQAGMRTIAEVKAMFGIDVRHFPGLFQLHGELVSRKPYHEQLYQQLRSEKDHIGVVLGVKPGKVLDDQS
jgi:hypothetical protein